MHNKLLMAFFLFFSASHVLTVYNLQNLACRIMFSTMALTLFLLVLKVLFANVQRVQKVCVNTYAVMFLCFVKKRVPAVYSALIVKGGNLLNLLITAYNVQFHSRRRESTGNVISVEHALFVTNVVQQF